MPRSRLFPLTRYDKKVDGCPSDRKQQALAVDSLLTKKIDGSSSDRKQQALAMDPFPTDNNRHWQSFRRKKFDGSPSDRKQHALAIVPTKKSRWINFRLTKQLTQAQLILIFR